MYPSATGVALRLFFSLIASHVKVIKLYKTKVTFMHYLRDWDYLND
jgi:hypothetical protein